MGQETLTPEEQRVATYFREMARKRLKLLDELVKLDDALCPHDRSVMGTCIACDELGDKLVRMGYSKPAEIPDSLLEPKIRSCNRHSDCDAAVVRFREKWGKDPGFGFHCHDECCEECFGY